MTDNNNVIPIVKSAKHLKVPNHSGSALTDPAYINAVIISEQSIGSQNTIVSLVSATLPEVKATSPILSVMPLSEWRGSATTFAGFIGTTPVTELENLAWPELSCLLAPNKPKILADKKQGQYVVPCMLKTAEFVGNTREAAFQKGQSTIGKMRSKSHVTVARFLIMDIDGLSEDNLNAGFDKLKQDGITYLAYTTHSHGSEEKLGMRVRIVLLLNRPMNVEEYTQAWHGVDKRYFNGKAGEFDASGANMYQQQGTWCAHTDRANQAQIWRNDDGIATTDALIDIGIEVLTAKGIKAKLAGASTAESHVNNAKKCINTEDYPVSDANKVADACKQIEVFRDTKGAGQSEPQWRNCIGVTAFCEDGVAITQDWSSGYADYDVTKTDAKMANRMKTPPTRCDQFKNTNPAGCNGCVQQCNSPITLGWKDALTAVDTVTITPVANVEPLNALATMQQQFALIKMSGKVWMLEGDGLNVRDNKGAVKKLELLPRGDGALLMHRALKAQFPHETGKVIDDFMLSPHTICYSGVEFNPKETSKGYLNLWVGPTVTPKAGGWEFIQAFLHTGICNGNQEHYNYLIAYIAHALQKPWEKPGVMIIMIGGQGVGKGTLGQILRKIWRATYLQVSNIDNVTGNFNASLERAYIVFMDEALFSGDRKASDALKSLVTEPVVHINEKHQPSRQTDSYLRFFLATNADHVKNTERDDRRDFVLRVSEEHKGDKAYWEALYHEIENGGVEAMVHDLLAVDLSEFMVRYKPSTKELVEQKLQSLGPIQRWWHDCLYRGEMRKDNNSGGADIGYDFGSEFNVDWPSFISTAEAIEGVMNVTGSKIFRKPTANDIVDAIKMLCPSVVNKQQQNGNSRHRGLALPPLERARIEFETYIGGSVQWEFNEVIDIVRPTPSGTARRGRALRRK
ncbi:MAG: DUF5906 domain-containing protein [Methylotenera sp.]|nr:DUF5906 domain-containing protein [Methylotenera sp.]